MELLKIDSNHDAYYLKNGDWKLVRDIERDDLLTLIQFVASNENIVMDECTDENDIRNPIEKTIYTQIYSVLQDLNVNRDLYLAEIDEQLDKLERDYDLLK